ncbi:hypothetical protein Pcinc_005996 [Petrolisthes cinctipes]|uniref:Protein kinase SIK1/2/3 UBA domain-containing protein n=1 Tax=Petrolisthes cinctipes TaxID=88211 RepID=A0AAE1L003_PETCI|nr:hypothetical protein Pcinc_005996 [Petrolisthes cinctipes]
MLVLDPTRRYTIEQIKRHRWMQAEELPSVALDPPTVRAERSTDPNEQVLRVMQELGIDVARTRESLLSEAYDNYTAIYLLLLERLKQHRSSLQGSQQQQQQQQQVAALEQQRRRPSSVAEAAMRKMAITSKAGSNPPVLSSQLTGAVGTSEVSIGGLEGTGVVRPLGHTGRMLPAIPGDQAPLVPLTHSYISNLSVIGRGTGVEEAGTTITPYVSPPFREVGGEVQTDLIGYQSVGQGGNMALVGKSYREGEGGPSTSIDEGVEADMCDSEAGSVSGCGPARHMTLQHIKSASQQSSEAGVDSPLGSVTSTESTFESFESQLEPDIGASLSSCSHASLTARPLMPGTTGTPPRSLQPQTQLDPAPENPERAHTRSPVNFREGRRASDGLVTQGVIAFRQRLLETEKARGLTELHSVQQEHQALTSLYQPPARQPPPPLAQYCRAWRHSYAGSDELSRAPLVRQRVSLPESLSLATHRPGGSKEATPPDHLTPKPLQQQLFQHRLLQQKRQILQKQAAYPRQSFPCELSRRQMVRQASYKLAQQQPVLPPLPAELSAANLLAGLNQADLACPTIAEHHDDPWEPPLWRPLPDPTAATWHTLPSSLAACQITEVPPLHSPQPTPTSSTAADTRTWTGLQTWHGGWHQGGAVGAAPWQPVVGTSSILPQTVCESPILEMPEHMET